MDSNIYKERGYKDRADYLKCMADDFGVPLHAVLALADVLGPDEDFDGLRYEIEDWGDLFEGTDDLDD